MEPGNQLSTSGTCRIREMTRTTERTKRERFTDQLERVMLFGSSIIFLISRQYDLSIRLVVKIRIRHRRMKNAWSVMKSTSRPKRCTVAMTAIQSRIKIDIVCNDVIGSTAKLPSSQVGYLIGNSMLTSRLNQGLKISIGARASRSSVRVLK